MMKELFKELNKANNEKVTYDKIYNFKNYSLAVIDMQDNFFNDYEYAFPKILSTLEEIVRGAKFYAVRLSNKVNEELRMSLFKMWLEMYFEGTIEYEIQSKKFLFSCYDACKHSIMICVMYTANNLLQLNLEFHDKDSRAATFSGLYKENYYKNIATVTPLSKLPKNAIEFDTYQNEVIRIRGTVFKIETREYKKGKFAYVLYVTDGTESIRVKAFANDLFQIREGDIVDSNGKLEYDKYLNDIIFNGKKLQIEEPEVEVIPDCELERVELHVHSHYDTMDAIPTVDSYFKLAKNRGVKALAVLDKENVLNFFDSEAASKKYGVKAIYGSELNVIDSDEFKIFYKETDDFNGYVGVDIETTGLSNSFDDIIEIAAVKFVNGKKEILNKLVNRPEGDNTLSNGTVELTGITKEMLDSDGVDLKEALEEFVEFVGDGVIVAHNATFDVRFIERKLRKLSINKKFSFIDTLNLSRALLSMRSYRLDKVADKLKIPFSNHHRAFYDAECALSIFEVLKSRLLDTEVDENCTDECFLDVRTTTQKAIDTLNELNLNILSSAVIPELKCGYSTTIKVSDDLKSVLSKIGEIKSTKVTRIYKKDDRYSKNLELLNSDLINEDLILKHGKPRTVTVLVKNQEGIKNLYDIISLSHTKRIGRDGVVIFKSDLERMKTDNLLYGSSSRSGLFESLYYGDKTYLDLYDYFEINPPLAYCSIRDEITLDNIKTIMNCIVRIARSKNKIVTFASNSHYLSESDALLYDILLKTDMVGNIKHRYKNSINNGILSYMTTDEVINSLTSVFDKDTIEELVFEGPEKINSLIDDDIKISTNELFVPTDNFLKDKGLDILDGENVVSIKEKFISMIKESLSKYEINGELPQIIKTRVEREVSPIIENGYHIVYYISYLLVKKSLRDGYSVGSRGSVGSSFVANLMGITEVNALKPHYRCPKCHFQIYKGESKSFPEVNEIDHLIKNLNDVLSGFDLKVERCPVCGEIMIRDGHDIPFETFLGFNGDKVPDIDLNFASVYQSRAHAFTKELFGEKQVVRAGTISTLADKTAYNAILDYSVLKDKPISSAEALRLSTKLVDIKRTTGQHASGIIVIPEGMRYEDFTPVQYPANDKEAWLTTHFEYSKIHDNLLKLDILGHIDPTVLKALMDEVKKNPSEYPFSRIEDIPICDPKIFDLLRKDKNGIVNALGISEFGTKFVMGILEKIEINSFSDLIKVSGLSHGTDVWQNNGEILISGKTTYGAIDFKDIIGCRDDIMTALISYGVPNKEAFDIMEFVRKGKLYSGGEEKWKKYEEIMVENNVPSWYIYSLSKIKYMFPKAHAVAYVMSALRIAWFKAYKPAIFYKVYFSIRDKKFDLETITSNNVNLIDLRVEEYNKPFAEKADKDKIPMLLLAKEAINNGINILKPDVNLSLATEFLIVDEKNLLTPFNMIPGVGDEMANKFVEKKKGKTFNSLDELKEFGAPKKILEGLKL